MTSIWTKREGGVKGENQSLGPKSKRIPAEGKIGKEEPPTKSVAKPPHEAGGKAASDARADTEGRAPPMERAAENKSEGDAVKGEERREDTVPAGTKSRLAKALMHRRMA
jgi:hypothetical protein